MKLEELHGELQEAVVEANKSYVQLTKTRDLLEEMIANNISSRPTQRAADLLRCGSILPLLLALWLAQSQCI